MSLKPIISYAYTKNLSGAYPKLLAGTYPKILSGANKVRLSGATSQLLMADRRHTKYNVEQLPNADRLLAVIQMPKTFGASNS